MKNVLIFFNSTIFVCRLCFAAATAKSIKLKRFWEDWSVDKDMHMRQKHLLLTTPTIEESSPAMQNLTFTSKICNGAAIYTHTTHTIQYMPETVAHRILRSSKKLGNPLLKVIIFCLMKCT